MKYIRDPLHGEIHIPDEVRDIVDHPLFQRLRNVSQLALVRYVYPSAGHTRFEHSLGVYYITTSATNDVATHIYALLHDVGHGPFSHLLELAFSENGVYFDHEKRAKDVSKEILQDSTFSVREVFSRKRKPIVDILSDRLDYLQRDSYFTGVEVGYIPWERILRNAWVEGSKVFVRKKVMPNIEHLYVARFILGDSVYFHKTVLILDRMFVRAIGELLENVSIKEIINTDEPGLISLFREYENRWWRMIEERKLFKIVFRGDEKDAQEVYDQLAGRFGEENVIFGRRNLFYAKPDIYLDDGMPVVHASALLKSLRRAEEGRTFYFVAIAPQLKSKVYR